MNKKDQTNKNIIIAGIGFFAIVIAIIAVINLFIPSSHAQVPASFASFDQQASFANFDQQASFTSFNQFDYSPKFDRDNAFANDFNFAFNDKFAFDKNARS